MIVLWFVNSLDMLSSEKYVSVEHALSAFDILPIGLLVLSEDGKRDKEKNNAGYRDAVFISLMKDAVIYVRTKLFLI